MHFTLELSIPAKIMRRKSGPGEAPAEQVVKDIRLACGFARQLDCFLCDVEDTLAIKMHMP